MQTAWKGAISFGLVSIPVRLHKATEKHGVSLHQVHAADGGRVRMRRVCERCGTEVPYSDIARGYEDEDGRQAVLTDSDLAELPLPSKKIVDVLAFVGASEIDPVNFEQAYYVAAEGPAAAKPYVLLRDALAAGDSVAITKIAIRIRESLALLRAHQDTLVLHTMYWPDEVRSAEGLNPSEKVTVRPQELTMARSLMETLSEGFELGELHDDYQIALDSLVAARLQGAEPVAPPEGVPAGPENVVDLMAALQASIEARGGKAAGGRAKEAAKRTAGKAPAKTAAKKATGKTRAKEAAPGESRGTGTGTGTGTKKAAKKASSRRVS